MALKGKEVLIIDDQSDIRMLIRKILENQGLLVSEAESVDEALSWVVNKTPHLIIVDLHMPKKNGFDFLEQRLQTAILKPIPVIVASGLRDQKSIYRAIQLGASDYILKPFSAAILVQKTRKSLRDQDFVGYTIPKGSPTYLTVSVNADISKISAVNVIGLEKSLKRHRKSEK